MSYKISNYRDDIYWIEVDNGKNIKCIFSNFGASTYSLRYYNEPMILELDDKEEFLYSNQYFNKTLGVTAGRVKNGITFLGKECSFKYLIPNTNFTLHGGDSHSISFKAWDYKVKEDETKIDVVFKIKTDENENGIPGKLKIEVLYRVFKNSDRIKIIFKVKGLKDSLVNLSNHIYWNFFSSKDINDYYLKFKASHYGAMDKNLLVIKEAETPSYLDFSKGKKLKDSLEYIKNNIHPNTIDDTFVFDEEGKVILRNEDVTLKMKTNYKAMNIYVDSSLTDVKFKNIDWRNERRAIALEPQEFIFDLEACTLKKDQKLKKFIDYKFVLNKEKK